MSRKIEGRGAKFRNKKQIARDRAFISRLFVKNHTLEEMRVAHKEMVKKEGDDYSVSISQIAYDCKQIMISWKRTQLVEIQDMVQRDVMKLDLLEQECWDAWDRSKKPKRTTRVNGATISNDSVSGGVVGDVVISAEVGDPRFLEKILDIMRERAKLLGYDKGAFAYQPEDEGEPKYKVSDVPENVLLQFANSLQNIN